jgi:WhiB family redox-sensing transcriptional regulator
MEDTLATAPYFDGSQPCMKVDPEVFFPEMPVRPNAEDKRYYSIAVEQAKAVCSTCSFINECLSYALYNDVTGVWGGTVDTDRNQIRKNKKILPPKSMSLVTAQWLRAK